MICRWCRRPIESPEMAHGGDYLKKYVCSWSWRLINAPTTNDLTCPWNDDKPHEPSTAEDILVEIAAWL